MMAAESEGWVSGAKIEALSATLGDSDPVNRLRRRAWSRSGELPLEPNPLYRKYGYFAGVDLASLEPARTGPAVRAPPLGSRTVQVLHDAAGSHVALAPELAHEGVRYESLEELWKLEPSAQVEFLGGDVEDTDRLSALARATVNRGYRLTLPPRLPSPVRVQDISVLTVPGEVLSVRRQIRVGEASSVIATEELFANGAPSPVQRWFASSTRVTVGIDARAAVLSIHAPDPSTVSFYERAATVAERGRINWMWNGFGGFRTKLRNLTELPGQGSDAEDLQSFYGDQEQSYDSGIQISHIGTDTKGQSITRGVFRDTARGMSRGLVRIEPEARKTLSYLSEHAMLLSRGARSDTIPILEILCRDVKATHSSSVAPVDPEKVFYLESRGMPREESIRMIGEGFLSHVLERSPIVGLREMLYPHLATRWEGRAIRWEGPHLPALPELHATGAEGTADWRFDAKLR